jgi:peptidoglycan/LPS O-acetylase OafA/YrhL
VSGGLATPPVQSTSQPRDRKTFRADIQGLRALGLILMFLTHAEVSATGGGFVALDLFFVLSGFLITGLILEEMHRSGTLSMTGFYARRIRRLLPQALFVLAVVVIVSSILYAPVRAELIAGDVIAASLYVVNWRFQAQDVDYFAVDPSDSPIQHFWSLSVEEQFYFVWPLLLLMAFVFIARRNPRRMRMALWAGVALVGVPSLFYNLRIIDLASNGAYFSTPARMWEFALGGALALVLPASIKLPKAVVSVLMWGGIAALLVTTHLYSFDTPYPGTAALVPTLATVGMLIAGAATVTCAPLRALCSRPAQYVGDLSYAWYLWHWPLLVFARELWGSMTAVEALLVIAVSWVPTALTARWIENPVRYSRPLARRPRHAIGFGFASIAVAVVMAVGLTSMQPRIETASSHEVAGAVAAVSDPAKFDRRADRMRPTPEDAKSDRGTMFRDGCLVPPDGDDESPECVYGHPSGDKTAVLFGDSHAMHYFPGLERVAIRRGWRLVGLTRAACTAAEIGYEARCDAWREKTLERIEQDERPDLVLVSTSTTSPRGKERNGQRRDQEESEPLFEAAFRRTLERLRATGARVVVIADTPRSPQDVAECVSEHPDELRDCAFRDDRRPEGQFDVRAARQVEGVRVIEPARLICPKRICAPVIGRALVFRDTNHLTASFSVTLRGWLDEQLPAV